MIADEELTGTEKYVVDWDGLNSALLDAREYITQLFYDGLNRVRLSILPEEVSDGPINDLPKELIPTYNRAGALQSIAFAGTEHVRHIAYNAKGQRVLMAMGNSMMTRYAYDPITFRLQRIKTEKYVEASGTYTPQSGTTKQDTAYVYDLGGNIITIKERVTDCGIVGTTLGANALDKLFTYDPLKRLLTATGRESNTTSANHLWDDTPVNSDLSATRAYTQHFTYDKPGNILLLDHDATGNNYNRYYRYTGGKNLLEQIDNDGSPADVYSTFAYDANGNLISSNTDRYYEWDAADQLRYFKIFDGSTITKQAHYLYAGGNRVKKVVRTGTALEITVYIDGVYEHRYKGSTSGPLLDQQHQNNYFVMDGRSRIATVRLGHAWGDTAPDLCYNLEDHLGTSTTRLTDTGTVVDREEYYPFGDSCLRTIDKKRYRYVGKERDEESGLYYYGARYYAAWVGRFVSVDPLADEYKQLTPYNYAANNPIGDFDIDGQQNNQTAPDLPAGATITENHPLWNVPPALRGKVLTGPGSSAGVGEAAPSTVELPPLKLPAAARDATSTRGALDPIPSSLPLNEQGPLGNFKSGIVSSKPRPHQTIGPADDDPYHKELSQYYRRQYQFRQAIEAARARDPFAVGVAQGLIEAARHPEDVAAVIVPELILLRLQKAAQVYKLTKLAAAGVRAEEALVSTRLLTAGEHLPNAGGKIISFVQETDQIYYRVYSESSVGAFLTATPPRSGAWAREALSLPPGNEATFVQEVLVPAGTRLQRSRALPVPEWNRMHGGGEQFQLLGPHHLPKENFGLGQPLM